MKCFFVTKTPWWNAKTKPQTRTSSISARELHYYYREEGDEKRGMVMVYGDAPSMNYWKFFVKNESHQKAEINQDERLIEQYLKYLTRILQASTQKNGKHRHRPLPVSASVTGAKSPSKLGVMSGNQGYS
ncbi:hypothetical protein [Nitrosomonas sp. Is37]|uniref:hypothetical protein n=1 Tax=Nitrosomonas sp. Is37 TaxID=3080535 RepID=UPI00294AB5FB|nr:hypothetical protein [Nitrosomonas sp. Is37]MDV6344960.1 hypothetical protein [Nitrosomonas sp. Is37]